VTRGRRAQQFHELVEGASTRGARAPASARPSSARTQADLLELVGALRAVPTPTADPAFVAVLRERLLAEAETLLVAAAAERHDTDARLRLRTTTPQLRRRHRRLAAAVSGVALVGASATMAYAAQSALPGDGLYSVKRGLESARAELTFDRGDRGRAVLGDASTRLDEAQQLSRTQADPQRVSDALDAFTQETISGSDLLVSDYDSTGDRSSIAALQTFTSTSMQRLDALQAEVPPQSLSSLLRAAQAVDQAHQTAAHTCVSCRGPALTSIPSVLAQTTQATVDSWQVAVPRPHHATQHLARGDDGGPVLPHIGGHLPPASVTDPDDSSAAPGDVRLPTADDVQHTVQHLTDGLTTGHQDDVASTVTDTATNLLDAVGQVGNTVADTVDGLVPGLLPSQSP
jgi:hypothetical protein